MAEQRVLLVDLDPQANLTSGVGLKGQAARAGTIYQALTSDVDDVSQFVLKTAIQGLSLIPADRNLTGAEIDLVTLPEREQRLRTCLDRLRGEFDYILVDTPPSLGLLTLNALVAADAVLRILRARRTRRSRRHPATRSRRIQSVARHRWCPDDDV